VVFGEEELGGDGEIDGQGRDEGLELGEDRLEEHLARPYVVLVARKHQQLLHTTHDTVSAMVGTSGCEKYQEAEQGPDLVVHVPGGRERGERCRGNCDLGSFVPVGGDSGLCVCAVVRASIHYATQATTKGRSHEPLSVATATPPRAAGHPLPLGLSTLPSKNK
jgi:hypothetical protein